MIITRRSFLRGLLAAPIIVAAPSLMRLPAKPLILRKSGLRDPLQRAAMLELEGFDQWGNPVRELLPFPEVVTGEANWKTITGIRYVQAPANYIARAFTPTPVKRPIIIALDPDSGAPLG